MPIIPLIVLATVSGALVGLATELTLRSRAKAHNLPGGSLASGFLVGVLFETPGNGWVSILAGAI